MCLTWREMDTRHIFTALKKPAHAQPAEDRSSRFRPRENHLDEGGRQS